MKLKPEKLFEELKAVAEQIGIQVIIDKGSFRGGYCTVYEERKIVLNKHLPPEGRAAKLAEGLKNFPLDGMYIKPALREYLDLEIATTRRNKAVKNINDNDTIDISAIED